MLIKLQRIGDYIGGNILCNVLRPFKKIKKIDPPKKILVINLWGIGDAVLTLPLIKEIKKRFPTVQLDVLATRRVNLVYTSQKDIDNVLLLENGSVFKHRRKYDLVFDTEHYLNSSALAAFYMGKRTIGYSHGQRGKLYSQTVKYNEKQHIVHTYLDLLRPLFPDVDNPKELIKLNYNEEDKKKVIDLLRKSEILENDFVVGFCASTAESAICRRWPKSKFAKLADILIEKYKAKIIIIGAPGEKEFNQEIINLMQHKENALNASGETSMEQSFALIDRCMIFVSNDTGPMHISAAQGKPTVGLFGPNTPVRYGPYGQKNIAVYKPTQPEPCINVHKRSIPDCKNHNHLSLISVENVLESVEEIFRKELNCTTTI